MRLIDADALIKTLEKYKFGCLTHEAEREYIKEVVIDFVKTEPTTYNVDAVVEEIKRDSKNAVEAGMCPSGFVHCLTAIDAVRKGGKND